MAFRGIDAVLLKRARHGVDAGLEHGGPIEVHFLRLRSPSREPLGMS